METMSLRERKKARLRARLLEVSQRLFQEQGFQETTLEQICAEAEVVPKTLLRYFESKQQLALAPHLDALQRFRDELSSPDRPDDVLSCWRRLLEETLGDRGALLRHYQLLYDTPALVAAMQNAVNVETEDLLATALAHEAGTEGPPDLRSRVLAALLVEGQVAVFRDWVKTGASEPLLPWLLEVVDIAEAALPAFAPRAAARSGGNGAQARRRVRP